MKFCWVDVKAAPVEKTNQEKKTVEASAKMGEGGGSSLQAQPEKRKSLSKDA